MGTLVLASYEETRAVFKNAAVFGACDDARGVTQDLIFGNVPHLGTGRSADIFLCKPLNRYLLYCVWPQVWVSRLLSPARIDTATCKAASSNIIFKSSCMPFKK